ncbi:uncharacterized protein [Argopecten irradians]|uniref:uncharacterized protein n=1 Tax=Argopecten irradians TaxID=31199 RepID=UPI00371794F9
MTTFLPEGQSPERPRGQTTCVHHRGRQLEFYCRQCEGPVCGKCVTSLHYCHPICELSEHISHRKRELQIFIDKTENDDLAEIDEYIKSADKSFQENDSNFDELYEHLLESYNYGMKMYSEYLRQKVNECKILLQRGSDIEICDTDCDDLSVILPEAPTLNADSVSLNRDPHGCLNEYRTSSGHDIDIESLEVEIGPSPRQQTSDSEVKTSPSQQQSIEEKVVRPGYTLLPRTKILEEWKSPCAISSIRPTTHGLAWICYLVRNELTLHDRKGTIVNKVKYNTKIEDISLSPTTNTLWACDEHKNILKLKSGQLQTRFSTNAFPLSICITASEHVIIGMENKISKFTTSGELVQTTEGRFVTRPWRISECPVSHNIAVANKMYGCNAVILDSDLEKLFVYTGEIPDVYATRPTKCSFQPAFVVYDSMGNLVIGDRYNNRLLLVSGRGQFIRIIHTDDHWSQDVGIDRQGVLWSAFALDYVKLLQYNDMYQEDNDMYQEDNDMYQENNDKNKCCVLL